jgi:hypothetical protein
MIGLELPNISTDAGRTGEFSCLTREQSTYTRTVLATRIPVVILAALRLLGFLSVLTSAMSRLLTSGAVKAASTAWN